MEARPLASSSKTTPLHPGEKHHPMKELPEREVYRSSLLLDQCQFLFWGLYQPIRDMLAVSLGLVGHRLGPLLPCRQYHELVEINVRLRESRACRLTGLP